MLLPLPANKFERRRDAIVYHQEIIPDHHTLRKYEAHHVDNQIRTETNNECNQLLLLYHIQHNSIIEKLITTQYDFVHSTVQSTILVLITRGGPLSMCIWFETLRNPILQVYVQPWYADYSMLALLKLLPTTLMKSRHSSRSL